MHAIAVGALHDQKVHIFGGLGVAQNRQPFATDVAAKDQPETPPRFVHVEDDPARGAFPKLAAQAGGSDHDTLVRGDLVNQWLVNADFATVDPRAYDSRIIEGKAAAWITSSDAVPRVAAALKAREPKAAVVALAPPVRNAGERALLGAADAGAGAVGSRSLALSARSAKLKVSALWVDFWYNDQGRLLQRRFDGRLAVAGHFDVDAWRARLPALAEAERLWARAATAEHALPQLWPAAAEASLEAEALPKAAALVEEMTVRIATGAGQLESFADYAKRIDALGMPRLLAAKQAELDRALGR